MGEGGDDGGGSEVGVGSENGSGRIYSTIGWISQRVLCCVGRHRTRFDWCTSQLCV